MKKNVAVTGAGGYIGRHVVSALLDMGHSVTAVDIKTADIDPRATVIKTNIFEDNQDIYNKLGCPDVCVHLAWRNGFVHNSETHLLDLSGHFNFVKSMIAGGLKNIAVMGSMHEVGYWEGAVDENTPCNPLSQYAIAKNALRQYIALMTEQNNVNLYWLRAYYVYGDDLNNNSVFTKIIEAANSGKTEFPFTTGKNLYDFIEINELARMIALTVTQDKITGIINVCTGKPVSLAEKIETFIKDKNLPIKLNYGAFPERPYDSPGIWGDANKINTIIKNFKESSN